MTLGRVLLLLAASACLIGPAKAFAAQAVEGVACEDDLDAVYAIARADRAWLAEVVSVGRGRSSGDPFVVTRSGRFRLRTVTPLKGVPPRTATGSWSHTFSDDGQTFGDIPVSGELYFAAAWDGNLRLVRADCALNLAEARLESSADPEPTGAALVAAGKSERLAGHLNKAHGMLDRAWEQIYVAIGAYDDRNEKPPNRLRLDFIESILERDQVSLASGGCPSLTLAKLMIADKDMIGPRADQIRADLDQAMANPTCPPPPSPPR